MFTRPKAEADMPFPERAMLLRPHSTAIEPCRYGHGTAKTWGAWRAALGAPSATHPDAELAECLHITGRRDALRLLMARRAAVVRGPWPRFIAFLDLGQAAALKGTPESRAEPVSVSARYD